MDQILYAPLITLFTLVICISVIFFVLLNLKRNKNTYLFLTLLIIILIWLSIELFLRLTENEKLALIFLRILNADMILFGIFSLLFGLSVVGKWLPFKIKSLIFAFGGVLAILAILTDKTAMGVKYIGYTFIQNPGILFPVYVFFFYGCSLATLFYLIRGYKNAQRGEAKNKIKYILMGITLPVLLGAPLELMLPLFGIEVLKLGSAIILIAAVFITYALLQYDL